jgi:TonB-linked SusC/RagA family outer membrane protein
MKRFVIRRIRNLSSVRSLFRSIFIVLILVGISLPGMQGLYAQEEAGYDLTGIVVDQGGESLPGVNIVIKGTTQGTITNINGQFTIRVSNEDVLVVSYVGFTTQEVTVSGQKTLSLILAEDLTELEEVVVIGYGSVKRANMVGAVENMKADEVEDIPATNLSTILEGKMAGVSIGQATGRPGASTSLSIRIENTYSATSEPLYVIDGFIRDKSTFDLLDPSEIESISVLKDASASVYGARGAYGVVLVKTKMGREGKTKVNYSGSYGISGVTQITEMLSAYEHASLLNEIMRMGNDSVSARYTPAELEAFKGLDYDWLESAWQPSSLTRHTINISGGSEKVRYFGGGSYYNETGNFENLNVSKYSLRLGLEADIVKGLTASFRISLDDKKIQVPFYKGDDSSEPLENTFAQLLQAPKWIPSYINGLPVGQVQDDDWWNPEALFNSNSYKRSSTKGNSINVNVQYDFPFLKGLSAGVSFNRGEDHSYGKQYIIPYTLYNFKTLTGEGYEGHLITNELSDAQPTTLINNTNRIFEDYNFGTLYQLNTSLSYGRDIGLHHFDAMIVYEQSESKSHDFRAIRQDLQFEGMETQRAFDPNTASIDGSMYEGGRLSSIGRLNYLYASKYILEASFRYEGSTLFAPQERWGLFPSVAIGWVVSQEEFFKNRVNFINHMKLRGSVGLLGNDNVRRYQWKYSFGTTGEYLFGSKLVTGLEALNSGLALTGVTWEKTNYYNVGADLQFLDSRLAWTLDVYYKYTYDIITGRDSQMPTSTGIDKIPKENYGSMKAWGYDMSLKFRDYLPGTKISWYIQGNFGFGTNRVIKKPQSAGVIGTYLDEEGRPSYGYETGFVVDGIISTQEQLDAILAENPDYTIFGETPRLGMLYFRDIGRPGNTAAGEPAYVFEPDGRVDDALWDQMHIVVPPLHLTWKHLLPTSLSLGGSWKGLKLDAVFGLAWGVNKELVDKNARSAPTDIANVPSFWIDCWRPDNPGGAYPSPYFEDGNRKHNTFWIRDVKELKLKILTISYQLPAEMTQQHHLPALRVYFTGTNLWNPISTFDYKDDAIAKYNSYPLMRTFNLGVNITL